MRKKEDNSVLTDEQKYEQNYGVAPDTQEDTAKKLRKLGVKVRSMQITIWLVDGTYLSPATMLKRLEEGYYEKKSKTDAGQDADVEVPAHKGRSARPVGSGVDSSDTDERVSKRKGKRSNGTRTSKAVRGQHSAPVKQKPERKTRKASPPAGERSASVSRSRSDNNTRETRVERRRRLGLDLPQSRGAKRSTRPRRQASRKRY